MIDAQGHVSQMTTSVPFESLSKVRVVLMGSPSDGLPSGVTEVSLSANPLTGSQVVVCQFFDVDSLVQANVGLSK